MLSPASKPRAGGASPYLPDRARHARARSGHAGTGFARLSSPGTCYIVAMNRPAVERRLAAILAADMVGYSRLMEADETGTLARLKAHRLELIDPAIAKNNGRLIKTAGDGMLVEFPSVADAVACAAEIQRAWRRATATWRPSPRSISASASTSAT